MRLAPGQHIRHQLFSGLIRRRRVAELIVPAVLKEHGVTAPADGAGGGGTPAAHPSGSASSSFRQAARPAGSAATGAQSAEALYQEAAWTLVTCLLLQLRCRARQAARPWRGRAGRSSPAGMGEGQPR